MKLLATAALAASFSVVAIAPAFAGTSVGVSIGINQPGVYGRIDLGSYPQPAVVYPQPVIVAPPPVVLERRPIYLYVPPVQQQDWRRYCGRYNACGQPVMFVREDWVRERYEHEHPGWRDNRGHGRGPDQRYDHDNRGRDDHRDHDGDRGRHDDH